MRTMSRRFGANPVLSLPLLLSLLALGCQSGARPGVAQVVRSPGYRPDSLETVAFLGFARGSAAAELAPAAMEEMIEAYLLAMDVPFAVVTREAAERRVVSAEGRRALKAVLDYWRDDKLVDRFELMKLAEEMAVGGFLLGLVDEWSQTAVSGGSGEAGSTRISASLSLYDGATGRRVWRANAAESEESVGMLGGVSVGSESETARTRELKQRSTVAQSAEPKTDMPEYDSVAGVVARALVRALHTPE